MSGEDVFFSLVAAAALGGMAYYYYMEKKRLDALEQDVGDIYEDEQRYYGESLKEYFDPRPKVPPLGPLYDSNPLKPHWLRPNPWGDYWKDRGYSKRYPITERIYKLADMINRNMLVEYDDTLFLMRLERYMEDYGRDHDLDTARQEDLERYLQQREKDRPPVIRPAVQQGEQGVKPVESEKKKQEEQDPVRAEIERLREAREERRKAREEEAKKEQERRKRAEEIAKLGQKTKPPEIKPSSSSVPAHSSANSPLDERVYDYLSRLLHDEEEDEIQRLEEQYRQSKIGESKRISRTDSIDKKEDPQ